MSDQPSCSQAGDGVSPIKKNAKGKVRHIFIKFIEKKYIFISLFLFLVRLLSSKDDYNKCI